MNEQEKAARFSAQVDRLLHTPATFVADDNQSDDDKALLDLAREMAMLDFSAESRFLRRIPQAKGDKFTMLGLTNGRRALAAAGATLLLLMLAVTLIAPVRAFAGELFTSLFVRHESIRIMTGPEPMVGPTATPFPVVDAMPDLTVAEVKALAPFPVQELSNLPEGYRLSSVHYNEARGKVTFLYLNDASLGIVLHQEPEASAEAWTIGADAVVERVTVNGVPGEYVRGTWSRVEPENGEALEVDEMTWDNQDPHQQLRWTDGGVTYTISTTVGQDLGLAKADLIALAESLR